MKKFLSALVSLLLVLALCIACSPKAEGDADSTTESSTVQTTTVPAKDSYLNGIELSKFAIVYSLNDLDYSERAADYIHDEILARTELNLPMVSDTDNTTYEYEIVVGETSREISSRLNADTDGTEFAILAEEKQIALEGDYFVIAAAAYYFVNTYVPKDNVSATIPTQVSIHEPIVKQAENYIVLIGDGMGLYQTKLFEHTSHNATYSDEEDIFYGYLLPHRGFSRTDSLSGTTDSAAGGTALSSGVKTINKFVGLNSAKEEVESLTELAASMGMSTAVMSTEASTGATPASFSAHTVDRNNSSEIRADQAALSDEFDTIIECGYDIYTSAGIETIEEKLVNVLDTLGENDNGFFMMYEEAHIDKHCHNKDMDNTFLALIRFNQVIARVMEYAFYNPETFVLITADHETGNMAVNSGKLAYRSGSHSSQDVPVFAYGDGAELFAERTVENIQIPQTIASFMGVYDFGDQSKYQYLK